MEFENEFSAHSFTELWEKYSEYGIQWITSRMPERHRPKIEAWFVKPGYARSEQLLTSYDHGEYSINHYLTHDPFPVARPEGYRVIKELST